MWAWPERSSFVQCGDYRGDSGVMGPGHYPPLDGEGEGNVWGTIITNCYWKSIDFVMVIIIIIIIIITMTMFMVLSSWHSHCESSPGSGSFDECRLSAWWPPTIRPNQPIWAVSPPIGCYHPQTPSPFYYYSARKLILILPSHGGWKAEST